MKQLLYFLLISCIYQQIICMKNSSGSSFPSEDIPLHDACKKGNVEQLRYWLAQPHIDVNAQDNEGYTPLHQACEYQHTTCVKLLLAIPHIDVGKKECLFWDTPFLTALKTDNEAVIEMFLPRKDIDIWEERNWPDFSYTDIQAAQLKQYQKCYENYCHLQKIQRLLNKAESYYNGLSNKDRSFFSDDVWKHITQISYRLQQNDIFEQSIHPAKHKQILAAENRFHLLLRLIVLYKRYNEKKMPPLFADYKTTYQQCHTQQKLSKEEESVRQEKRLHHQLRKSCNSMQCTLFLELLRHMGMQSNTEPVLLIAHYYAHINNEVVVAWFYRKDPYYYALPEEQRARIKNALLYKNPESLAALWRRRI